MPDPLKLPIIIQRDATLVPRVIRILHPGYYPPENTLLHLHAVDDGGIDFDTVMAMCSILTGNTTIGFLSARKRGPGPRTYYRVHRPPDGILRESQYSFQLPNRDAAGRERPYPVVARFDDWAFPHGALPTPWKELAHARRDQDHTCSCRITDAMWALRGCFVVPPEAEEWWDREDFSRYAPPDPSFPDVPAIINPGNTIRLRSDLATVLSEKVFALVPKRDPTEKSGVSLVVHVVNPHLDMGFQQVFHNRRVIAPNCRTEVLFARFAWTVFSPGVLRPFLDRCVTNRYLLVHDPETGEMTVETWSPEQSRAILDAAMPPCRGIPEQALAVLAAAVQSACESPVGGERGGEGEGEGEVEDEGKVENEGEDEGEGEDESEDESEGEETQWRGRLRKRPREEE